ncbi:MAG TPA: amidohydrolase family protein [Dehalococcoidia bacterium]|nr:amidohydrolase family protein [Dehalococcoidia bacterium]
MLRIDVHAHMIPAKFVEGQEVTFPVAGGEPHVMPLRPMNNFPDDSIYGIERRLRDMDEQGIDMHVISLQPMFTDALPVERAVRICSAINDAFAEVVAANPKRFAAIAHLPMRSPADAVRELERAVRDLGLRGAEICSQIAGENLDEPKFAPFWAKAQELDVPIFIHPAGVPGLGERLGKYYLTNLIGNPMDTTIAAASLIFGGVLREYPRLKVYLAHGGGACPYIRYRWDHGWKVRGEGKAVIDRPPSEYLSQLYFDSLTHGGPALSFLASTVGPERIMLGTDYPFDMGAYNSVAAIQNVIGITDAERDLMLGGNAMRLFKIDG